MADAQLSDVAPKPARSGVDFENWTLSVATLVVEAMPIEMERLQRTCAAASEAVGARYFSHSDTHAWTGGVSL